MSKFKSYLDSARKGTGGLLFMFVSGICALTMVFTITFIRDSTARAVAESTEHTIAMECLASCYSNNLPAQTWNSNYLFPALNSYDPTATPFDPLKTFNDTMHSYRLMAPEYSVPADQVYMKYDTSSPNHPTFEIQFGPFQVFDSWWDDTFFKIYPNPMQVVIEDN